jgi:hypothetical protein
MVEPFSPFTKVIIRPCADCKRDCAILVGSRVLKGEIVSVRCPDCHQKFKEKYPDRPDMDEARKLNQLLESAELKPGEGE